MEPNEVQPLRNADDKTNVLVPKEAVGFIMGVKGASIKRIQELTKALIRSPYRNGPPIFEVSGLPEAVELAKGEINRLVDQWKQSQSSQSQSEASSSRDHQESAAPSTSGQFGSTTMAPPGTTVKFTPKIDEGVMQVNNFTALKDIQTKHQCISAMEEYESKSLEVSWLQPFFERSF